MDYVRIRKRREEEEEHGPFAYHSGWPYVNIGFGNERDYFIENLSLLIAGGLGVTTALAAIQPGVKNRRMRRVVAQIEEMVTAGYPLWQAFTSTKFFPKRIIAIIRAGEESGRLPEHLSLVSIQEHKERIFVSRIRSALLYPSIIFVVALVVGIGSAWYTLPKLTSALSQSSATLPATTQAIVWLGDFFARDGWWAVPAAVAAILLLIYIFFIFKPLKFIGEKLILSIPAVKQLIQGVEVARFGFLFGAMLQAGIVVTESLNAVSEGTSFVTYKKFYNKMGEDLGAGSSLEACFANYKHSERFVPLPMQQLIIAAEKSGKLPETLIKVGQIFEEKTESMTKDLATVLEPLVLVGVAIVVALLAMGIISPIYSLVNQIQ